MARLCMDQLAGKLLPLFREADPKNIDGAVTQAKGQLAAEVKQARHEELVKFFDAQIAVFENRGVPEQIIRGLRSQKSEVVQKASGMIIGEVNIPFLPVIKPAYLGYYGLMAMVKSGSNAGYTHMNPAAITDKFETPDGLYYIYDVEDGSATRGISPQDAEKIFKNQLRFPLTVAESISFCILTDVLSHHYLWAAGSRYESSNLVPSVYLDIDNQPKLDWSDANNSYVCGGSASFGSL